MKKFSKILSVALLVALVLSLGITSAFAGSSSITITPQADPNGTNNASYHYYQLLRASITTLGEGQTATTAVSYYLLNGTDDDLREKLDAVEINGKDVFTFTQSTDSTRWNVSLNSDFGSSDGEAIADALNTSDILALAISNGTFNQSGEGVNRKAQATGLDDGYYLVTSTLGSKLVLQTIGDVSVQTKNEFITNTKTASKTNMEVGDIVTYTITVHIPATANVDDVVTVHDTLDEHLAAKLTTLKATLGTGENAPAVTLTEVATASGDTFTRTFKVTSEMLVAGGSDVVITYDAELLSTAADDTGYVNKVYSNTSSYETKPDKVRVWTFDFDLDKNFADVTGDDAKNFTATFELAGSDNVAISFIKDGNTYVKVDSDDQGGSTVLTVNGKDIIKIKGLEAGTYTLTEKTTASGYNLLTDAITVTITDTTDAKAAKDESITPTHTVSYKIGASGEDKEVTSGSAVVIENNHGTVLPSTGGIGTTIFYVVGGVLVLAAIILLVTKKRMSE